MALTTLFVAAVLAGYYGGEARLFEQAVPAPAGWRLAEETPAKSLPINLQLALTPNADLEPAVLAVATPGSETFHQYWTAEEIAASVGPSNAALDAVVAWVSQTASDDDARVEVCRTGDWALVKTTVGAAEDLLSTKFAMFENKRNGNLRKLHAITSYELPDALPVDFVAGVHTFLAFQAKRVPLGPRASARGPPVTPSVLDALYSLQDSSTVEPLNSTNSKTTQAVVQFGDNFNDDDLETFYEKERPTLSGETVSVIGTNRPNGLIQGEANLDTQYVSAVGAFVKTFDYGLTLTSDPAGFLQWTYMVSNMTDPPLVHSISYGEYGGNYDNATVQRFSYELMKLGLLGISVTLASGDNGVGCSKNVMCGTGATPSQEFDFPSSPYITMVGATVLGDDGVETGATLSSGGFSSDYYLPGWQEDAVQTYLDTYLGTKDVPVPSETYNALNTRGYPDVAAIGENVQVVIHGSTESIGGTSCSSPMFAGILASLNAQLLANGEPPLGWVNPWLYAHPDMFQDIVAGSNPYGCCDGFAASPGWDPVTGLGTPNFATMLKYALADAPGASSSKTKVVQNEENLVFDGDMMKNEAASSSIM